MSHALYRFYHLDVLLYVGITGSAPARFRSHEQTKSWWSKVTRIEFEWYPDRATALDAEREAIKAEVPIYNEQHNKNRCRKCGSVNLYDEVTFADSGPVGFCRECYWDIQIYLMLTD